MHIELNIGSVQAAISARNWLNDRLGGGFASRGRGVHTIAEIPNEHLQTLEQWVSDLADAITEEYSLAPGSLRIDGYATVNGRAHDITYREGIVRTNPPIRTYRMETFIVSPRVNRQMYKDAAINAVFLVSDRWNTPEVDDSVPFRLRITTEVARDIPTLMRGIAQRIVWGGIDSFVVNVYDEDRCVFAAQLVDSLLIGKRNPDRPLDPPVVHPLLSANTERSLAAYRRLLDSRNAKTARHKLYVTRRANARELPVRSLRCMANNLQMVVDTKTVAGRPLFRSGGCAGCALPQPKRNIAQYLRGGELPDVSASKDCYIFDGWRHGAPGLEKGDLVVPLSSTPRVP